MTNKLLLGVNKLARNKHLNSTGLHITLLLSFILGGFIHFSTKELLTKQMMAELTYYYSGFRT